MPARPLALAALAFSAQVATTAFVFTGGDLLGRARTAAGGVTRFEGLQSIEVRGHLAESDAGGARGAMAIRMMLPDKFLVVERTPGRALYIGGLDGPAYWARYGERELPPNDEARRSLRYRANGLLASYLLHVPAACKVTEPAAGRVAVDEMCGGFQLEFGTAKSTLDALSYTITIYRGGDLADVQRTPGASATERLLNRPTSQTTVRTEFSDYRQVDGWRMPFVSVTAHPNRKATFSVSTVRLNPPLSARDFKPGASLAELQQWVDSATR